MTRWCGRRRISSRANRARCRPNLERQMAEAAANLDFETAAILRDRAARGDLYPGGFAGDQRGGAGRCRCVCAGGQERV